MRSSDWSSDVCSSDLAHAVARQQGGRAFNHVAIIHDALTLLLGGIALRHLPARAKRHPKPFGQICASAKLEYCRAAVVQPLAQRSIAPFAPRLPSLTSPPPPSPPSAARKKIQPDP